jgi:hypothetical protein
LLPGVTTRCTFWLDAHECGSGAGDAKDCPLLEELSLIAMHEIKEHTILIDDVRLFGTDSFPSVDQVIGIIKAINPVYKIIYVNSSDFIEDILVAKV